MFNFICVRIIKYDSFCQIYELNRIKDKNNTPQLIECKDKYLMALDKNNIHRCSRNTIYGLKEYSDIVVRKNYISGFEDFPDYGTCCIYSPFSKKEQINQLLNKVKEMSEHDIKSKHPIKYTKNNGCNSFVRVCSHCCYNSGNHCYFSICVVRVAKVHHMMHSAYMASLQ